VRFTDENKYFVSEASVYRLLKAHDLITSPAYVVIKAANEFKDKTTAVNQLWQTDFTYLKITGWGWYYLSTVLDDFARYIVAWRLGPTMSASDVTATLDQALAVAHGVAVRPPKIRDQCQVVSPDQSGTSARQDQRASPPPLLHVVEGLSCSGQRFLHGNGQSNAPLLDKFAQLLQGECLGLEDSPDIASILRQGGATATLVGERL
jgi:integrase-like protein